jgi:MoaA/NifB/PqqE/SkfB family radical SAM enzyme
MLLTPDRAVEVVDLGVTSLSVSLDGATAVTNDSLRAGGKLAAIVRNLELLTRAREARGFDLRVGISTVVTAGNAGELPALGHLAREVGVDWIKVEELFPCTPRARKEMIEPRDPRVAGAVAQLRDTLEGTSIVLVEHLDPPRGCGCDALNDERTRQFRQADDFANRTVFQPCRMEWEQACIDPDGTVHAVTYDAPSLGSLAEASMLEIWNGEAAQHQRERALRRTRASVRRACRC